MCPIVCMPVSPRACVSVLLKASFLGGKAARLDALALELTRRHSAAQAEVRLSGVLIMFHFVALARSIP